MNTPEPRADLSAEVLGAPREFTSAQVSDAVGIPMYRARRFWRAMGFGNVPEDVAEFTSADVNALSTLVGLMRDGVLDERQALELARTLGRSAARLANSHGEPMVKLLGAIRADTEREAVARGITDRILPEVERLLLYSWRRHLAVVLERLEPRASDVRSVAITVGFADLVGFTRLSRQLSDHELARLVARFEDGIADLITARGGRLVKSLGDEVLFVADTAVVGAEIGIEIAENVSRRRTSGIRVGLEHGPVVSHAGDVFGDTVNLASRLTAMAEPNCVLVGPALASVLATVPSYELVMMQPVDVRGFGLVTPGQLRRVAQHPFRT